MTGGMLRQDKSRPHPETSQRRSGVHTKVDGVNDGIADTDVGRRIARKKDRLPNQRRNLERLKADNSSAQRSSQGSETARTQSHQPAPHEVGWRIIPPTGNTPGPRTKDPHHMTGGTAAQRRPPTESREDDESWLV